MKAALWIAGVAAGSVAVYLVVRHYNRPARRVTISEVMSQASPDTMASTPQTVMNASTMNRVMGIENPERPRA